MLKRIGFIVLLTALSGAASATPSPPGVTCKYLLGMIPYDCQPIVKGGPTVAPEIDLGSTAAGMTLALGGLVVLRARRAQSEK
jgi:hypothetical protein